MTICTEQCYKPRSHWEHHFLYSSVVMIACFRVKVLSAWGWREGQFPPYGSFQHHSAGRTWDWKGSVSYHKHTVSVRLWEITLTLGLNFLIFILKYFSGLRWEMTENNIYKVKSIVLPHSKHRLNIGFFGCS